MPLTETETDLPEPWALQPSERACPTCWLAHNKHLPGCPTCKDLR